VRLFPGKIPIIAKEVTDALVTGGDIETEARSEVELDIEAVLKEYLRVEREITERAKDMLEKRRLPYSQFGKARKAVADERGVGVGEDVVGYLADQIIGSFMHSVHVEEVFSPDETMRAKMAPILRRHMAVDEELDAEVKAKIKNLEEGTRTWDVEYQKVMEQIKRRRGLE
jgi:hypothetical protein